MTRTTSFEISEHDQLILMMARYFNQLGYTDIKADIPGWTKPDYIYWTNNPNNWYYPDLTCLDKSGISIILEAETCNTLNDEHTKEQFEIFRARANKINGRFEVVVPRICNESNGRDLIQKIANSWGIRLDNIWTPSS
jgi:hypothetical protein